MSIQQYPESIAATFPPEAVADLASLTDAIKACALVADKRSRIPILANVRLLSNGVKLFATATDMDMELSAAIPAASDSRFAFTVPAHVLADFCKSAPVGSEAVMTAPTWKEVERKAHAAEEAETGQETVTMWEMDEPAKVRFGAIAYTMQALPVEDFPNIGKPGDWDSAHRFTMPGESLREMLSAVAFAMSKEETRYYLNGVYLHTVEDAGHLQLVAVATDGHRLAKFRMDAPKGAEGMPCAIICQRTVDLLLKLWRGKACPAQVRVFVTEKRIKFVWPDRAVVSKLVDGTYPDYGRVIPSGNDKVLTVDSASMKSAIAAVTKIASKRGRMVRLDLESGKMRLSVSNPDAGSAETDIAVEYESEPLTIGFNARHLVDILNQVAPGKTGSPVTFRLAEPGSPMLIAGEREGFDTVLMPVQV